MLPITSGGVRWPVGSTFIQELLRVELRLLAVIAAVIALWALYHFLERLTQWDWAISGRLEAFIRAQCGDPRVSAHRLCPDELPARSRPPRARRSKDGRRARLGCRQRDARDVRWLHVRRDRPDPDRPGGDERCYKRAAA